MPRALLAALVSLFLSSCATDASRYNIDYDSLSSSLYVAGPDGEPIPPFGGNLVDVDDIGIGTAAIRLVPGRHVVKTVCPSGSDAIEWTHGQPGLVHTFEVGKAYILRCEDGYPAIRPYERPN